LVRQYFDNSEETMARTFSELRAKMTPEARQESAKIAAALRTDLLLYERQRALEVQMSKDSEWSTRRHENDSLAGADPDTCDAMENVATYLQLDMDASMTITTISAREFNQDTSRAKKAAQDGPVFITDRGRPAHVLITIEEYQRLTGRPMTLAEALAQPDVSDIDFDPPKMRGPLLKPVDFS
jgi:prevent-host-death family protein